MADPSSDASRPARRARPWRERLWLVPELWRPSVLRIWPETGRLLLAAALLGTLLGLGFFVARARPADGPAVGAGRASLGAALVGPGTPTPSLYDQGGQVYIPYTPPSLPTSTPSPTPSPRPTATPEGTSTPDTTPTASPTDTPTPGAAQLVLQPPSASQMCATLTTQLSHITITLSNATGGTAANWRVTVNGGWAAAFPTNGIIPAGQSAQLRLRPALTLCATPGTYTATIAWTSPGGQGNATFTFMALLPTTPTP